MGFWKNLLKGLRIGAAVAGAHGVKVKGVPIEDIAAVAEREGAHVADAVKDAKAKRPKPSPGHGTTGTTLN